MRAHKKQFIEWTLLIVLWLSAIPGWSQEEVPFAEENTYITVSGVVKDKQNTKDFRGMSMYLFRAAVWGR